MKKLVFILIVLLSVKAKAQKIESITFNLYTDSLKKGVYNYINVDGRLGDSTYQPLMTDEVAFTSNAGRWDGNSIIIDSAYARDSVVITATLKSQPTLKKDVTIYIKKVDTNGPLKTEKELLEEWKKRDNRRN